MTARIVRVALAAALVLQHAGGNVTQAARTLDIDRVTLYNKIRKYGLRRHDEDGFGSA